MGLSPKLSKGERSPAEAAEILMGPLMSLGFNHRPDKKLQKEFGQNKKEHLLVIHIS